MSFQFLRGLGDDAATRSEAPLRCPASQRGRRASMACWTSPYGVLKETTDDAARSRLSRRCSRSCAGVLLINASSNDAPAQRPSSSRRSMSASIAVTDAFVEAYRQVCPRVIVDAVKRKFSPDRSRGILIASALAVASFGIGTGPMPTSRK